MRSALTRLKNVSHHRIYFVEKCASIEVCFGYKPKKVFAIHLIVFYN